MVVLLLIGTALPLALHVSIELLTIAGCPLGAAGMARLDAQPCPLLDEPARHASRKPNSVIKMRLCGLHPKHARSNPQSRTVIAASIVGGGSSI